MNKDLKNIDPLKLFDESWALVTSGDINNHNSMTISWGELGTLWHRNVVTIFIKPCRYTFKYLQENEYFVVSFFDERYRSSLGVMGKLSGRNVNKDLEAKLTPKKYKNVTIYQEAKISLICKKIYFNQLDINNIPQEEIDRYYRLEEPHYIFIGEIVEEIDK